jgi:signal transduction histidine kinase
VSEIDVRIAGLELAGELADSCRAHGIPEEWITGSRSLHDLIARVLERCNQRLAGPHEPPQGELRELLAFAREATELCRRTTQPPGLVSRVEDLERLRAGAVRAEAAEESERTAELLTEIGALCHQINNPLTSLMGRVQILRMKPDADAEAVERALAVIDESARRVATHVQELGHLVGRSREKILARD